MKRSFSTIFTRCRSCNRFFRSSSGFHPTCRSCRSEQEMAQFFEWLDSKL